MLTLTITVLWLYITIAMVNTTGSSGFHAGSVVKSLPANAGEPVLFPGEGRSPGEGEGNSLHSSRLGNPMDREAWLGPQCHRRVRHNLMTKQQEEAQGKGIHQFSAVQFSSVAQSCPTLPPHESQHARPLCPSPTPGVYSNPCPSSQ